MKISSAKAILHHGGSIVSILRDGVPSIPFPDHWDLPGGGLEAGETAIDGLLREIEEEIGLRYAPESFVWDRIYERPGGRASHFFAGPVTAAQIDAIVFGNEG